MVTYEQVWTATNDQFPKNTGSNIQYNNSDNSIYNENEM